MVRTRIIHFPIMSAWGRHHDPRPSILSFGLVFVLVSSLISAAEPAIPKPEHPDPTPGDRSGPISTGRWEFRFDANDQGTHEGWEKPEAPGYDRTIVVPFPWESELSGIHQVKDAPKIGWYRRRFTIPKSFPVDQRVWLRFGAGRLARRRLGQRPKGRRARRRIHALRRRHFRRADARRRKRRGRPSIRSDRSRTFRPASRSAGIPPARASGRPSGSRQGQDLYRGFPRGHGHPAGFGPVLVDVAGFDKAKYQLDGKATDRTVDRASVQFRAHESRDEPWRRATAIAVTLESKVRDPELWSPEHPDLYDVTLELKDAGGKVIDSIETYFGLRTISRGKYGDEPFERILLNGKPLYLRAALDQSFNPKGLYTAPDDDFLKRDMMIAKEMGLNALRIHIKPDEPRRLYWADQIGVLIMEDMPNTWRQTPAARAAWERTMREAVVRDRNHPSIIVWVAFNETWGLGKAEDYKKDRDTQAWVAAMVDRIRGLDRPRAVGRGQFAVQLRPHRKHRLE